MGRNYVMSDIHGMSGLLKKMLDIIQPGPMTGFIFWAI